jgi:(1->4)-alpha-D-glucan 1-alpha-D-glucosylmutase
VRIPASTYRLQLNADFPLSRVRGLTDYFQKLGVGDLYLSPVFEARPLSPHGYDVTHPGRLNPEIGEAADLEQLSRALHERGMGIIIDIVPNHMAASEANPWWRDVLTHGPASLAAHFFDIDWHAVGPDARLVLPLLGRPLDEALAAHELQLEYRGGGFLITYFGRSFPVDPGTYAALLHGIPDIDDALIEAAHRIGTRRAGSVADHEQRRHAGLALEHALQEWASDELNAQRLQQRIANFSANQLRDLLVAQPYALEFWHDGMRHINYRRFFDVADLAAVRVEDPDVFSTTHSLILDWVRHGQVDGVRVDHVDGLRDPAGYLRQLRAAVGDAYVVVEKILAPKEDLPENWPVEGTTGYDFIGLLGGLYCDPDGLGRITESYERRTGLPPFGDVVYDKKKLVIDLLFPAELSSLTAGLLSVAELAGLTDDRDAMAACITEVAAALHVYRTYIVDEVGAYDRCVVKHAVNAARHRAPHIPDAVYALLRNVLLNEEMPAAAGPARARFIADWQQFTGPVMAKGSEDTALYVYYPLIALSEVGTLPGATTASASELHDIMTRRAYRWPYTLSASSTHDTKYSEDVRARIQVLSEQPDGWQSTLERWSRLAEPYRQLIAGRDCPDPNEEILIYQTLLGVWPLTATEETSLPERLARFLRKAAREAKQHSSWGQPNEPYEDGLVQFMRSLLRDAEFIADLRRLEETVGWFGALNSLSQLVVKLTAPGVPDFYQGNESWSFRLVDPDNRSAVDFDRLQESLATLADPVTSADAAELLREWQDGRIKLHVTRAGLRLRKNHARLFTNGEYIPIAARGRFAGNIIAFARRLGEEWALVVAGRYYSKLGPRPLANAWGDTALELPPDAPRAWHNALTGEVTNGAALEAVLATLPFAILIA